MEKCGQKSGKTGGLRYVWVEGARRGGDAQMARRAFNSRYLLTV